MSRGDVLVSSSSKAQLITISSEDFQTKVVQSKGWLSVASIYDLWDGCMDKHKVRSVVPCCGQDGNRAQVTQHSIDSSNI